MTISVSVKATFSRAMGWTLLRIGWEKTNRAEKKREFSPTSAYLDSIGISAGGLFVFKMSAFLMLCSCCVALSSYNNTENL